MKLLKMDQIWNATMTNATGNLIDSIHFNLKHLFFEKYVDYFCTYIIQFFLIRNGMRNVNVFKEPASVVDVICGFCNKPTSSTEHETHSSIDRSGPRNEYYLKTKIIFGNGLVVYNQNLRQRTDPGYI